MKSPIGESVPVRILVADDEPRVRSTYQEVLADAQVSENQPAIDRLRARVLGRAAAAAPPPVVAPTRFEVVTCEGAEAAVAAVREALQAGQPFAVAFLDMRMPPGPDGLWAAQQLRALDPGLELVLCTAYSDVDPADIARRVPPAEKLFYLEKPFHPFEVRQMATALGSKWAAERGLARLAYFDSLTGLSNRASIHRQVDAALDAAREQSRGLTLLYIDLDNFKRINDTLGHGIGDELLCVVAERLRRSLRASDEVARMAAPSKNDELARLAGDEFCALLPDTADAAGAAVAAERILRNLSQPVRLGMHDILVTPSIGVAVFPTDGSNAEELFRHADLAMYFAKRQGAGRVAFYDATMSAVALQRMTIEINLRTALEKQELCLYYQPQFQLETGLISGMEALIRWNNSELGAVPPNEFIPVAETTGLILPIGEWVLRTACAQLKAWQQEGSPELRMAVNVSAVQFTHPEFPAQVARVLEETGVDPTCLELEVTESVIMEDESGAAGTLAKLKQLGVSLSIDDFGTGYSNLARLREFPVDRLKVDRSFVRQISTRSNDRTITDAILAMARKLQIDVVAEGVEDFSQLLHLQEQQCDFAQGFLLSRPMPSNEARQFLQRLSQNREVTRTARLKSLMQ